MKVFVIYNPLAGGKRARKWIPQVQQSFQQAGIQTEFTFTKWPGHATQIASSVPLQEYDGIVAAGGDGTLFEVVNGWFANPSPQKAPLGVLPLGTGNAFARDIGLETHNWQQAISLIARGRPRKLDAGLVKMPEQSFYYLNIVGLGFVANVIKTAIKLKWMGNIAYTLGVLWRTLQLQTVPMVLEYDGKKEEKEAVFIEISNTRYTSNFLIAPHARLDDGKLDVILLKKLTRRKLLRSFPKVFTGEHIHLNEVEAFQVHQLKIQTAFPCVLSPDGELMGTTPVEIQCVAAAVPVFV